MIPITPIRGVWCGSIWWSVSAHNWNVKSAPFRLLDSAQMSETVDTARQDLLRTVAAGTAGVVGEEFLQRLVQAVGETFGGGVCWISELSDSGQSARSLASWPPEALPAGREYKLEGTPCQLLHERTVVSYESGLPAAFPDDPFLIEHGLDGYLAVTCPRGDGRPIGYLAVTTQEALDARPDELAALQIFAARIGAELERRKQESRLREREAALIASRAKVLEAADEERKRIGRDLHDGAQQRLIALGQFLDVAGRKLDSGDAAEARRLLRIAREQVTEAGAELRSLAHGLHPVALERGLKTALDTLAMQAPVALEVSALPDRRLPDVVEATIFYVVAEALSNAVKHARASVVRVAVSLSEAIVHATVADDGIGGADLEGGTGLVGLRGRVEALSGTLAVASAPGAGTTLELTIPVMPWRSAREPFIQYGSADDDGRGERLIRGVLDGIVTCALTLAREWDLEGGLPRIGQLLPVRDRHGDRYATVRVTRVSVVAFSEVDADAATAAMGEPTTIEQWRADRWRFFEASRSEIAVVLGETDWSPSQDEPMAAIWFTLA
jgi:signal transduction histidine kinase/uncharacterized protein YhfF